MNFASTINSANKQIEHLGARLALLALCVAALLLFFPFVASAIALAAHDDRYLQIVCGPLICLYLIYWDRKNVFSKVAYAPRVGIPLLSVGALLCLAVAALPPNPDPIMRLVPVMFALIVVWQAAFLYCFGTHTFRTALYALCCLWLSVPLPPGVLDRLTAAYQQGSVSISFALLELVGVPVFHDDTSFSIPGLDFRIAPECSGIHSGLAFLMVALLAGRLYLGSGWGRAILILSTIPIAMFKNAVRIVVTTSLGAYVDRSFIDGPFHHRYGGIIFSPLDFLLFIPLMLGLRKLERLGLNRKRQPSQPVLAH